MRCFNEPPLNLLINKLEKLYVKDSKASAYLAYEKFASFQRPTNMDIIDYLNEFDIQGYEMTLPSGVLAYRVLKSANLTPEKQQLARATITELTYENFKKQLKAIHDSSSSNSIGSFEIKSEPTFVNETKDEHTFYGNSSSNRGKFNSKRGYNNGGKQWRVNNQQKFFNTDKYGRKMNPLNSSGNITKCSICQSIYHWVRDCPHKVDDTSTQVKLSLFTDEVYNCYINKFVGETLNHAILDSGCTKKFVVQRG